MSVSRYRRGQRRFLRTVALVLFVLAVLNAVGVVDGVAAGVVVGALIQWLTALMLAIGAALCLHAAE
jgi:hypothetical protein